MNFDSGGTANVHGTVEDGVAKGLAHGVIYDLVFLNNFYDRTIGPCINPAPGG